MKVRFGQDSAESSSVPRSPRPARTVSVGWVCHRWGQWPALQFDGAPWLKSQNVPVRHPAGGAPLGRDSRRLPERCRPGRASDQGHALFFRQIQDFRPLRRQRLDRALTGPDPTPLPGRWPDRRRRYCRHAPRPDPAPRAPRPHAPPRPGCARRSGLRGRRRPPPPPWSLRNSAIARASRGHATHNLPAP